MRINLPEFFNLNETFYVSHVAFDLYRFENHRFQLALHTTLRLATIRRFSKPAYDALLLILQAFNAAIHERNSLE